MIGNQSDLKATTYRDSERLSFIAASIKAAAEGHTKLGQSELSGAAAIIQDIAHSIATTGSSLNELLDQIENSKAQEYRTQHE